MTFEEAAEETIRRMGHPMHVNSIVKHALDFGLLNTKSGDIEATMRYSLDQIIREGRDKTSNLTKIGGATWTLREFQDGHLELDKRKTLFSKIPFDENGQVEYYQIVLLGLYKPQAGIYAPYSESLGRRVTLSFLITGTKYEDKSDENFIEYSYPNTQRLGADNAEIDATKATMQLKLPIYVITGSKISGKKRSVQSALVRDFDDNSKKFLVEIIKDIFSTTKPDTISSFQPFEEDLKKEFRNNKVFRRDPDFRFGILKRYGTKCAVCSISIEDIIEAAHIVEKKDKGSDDIRNGIPLCANHHTLFDRHFFSINEEYKVVVSDHYDRKELSITEEDITKLKHLPEKLALNIRIKKFVKATNGMK